MTATGVFTIRFSKHASSRIISQHFTWQPPDVCSPHCNVIAIKRCDAMWALSGVHWSWNILKALLLTPTEFVFARPCSMTCKTLFTNWINFNFLRTKIFPHALIAFSEDVINYHKLHWDAWRVAENKLGVHLVLIQEPTGLRPFADGKVPAPKRRFVFESP